MSTASTHRPGAHFPLQHTPIIGRHLDHHLLELILTVDRRGYLRIALAKSGLRITGRPPDTAERGRNRSFTADCARACFAYFHIGWKAYRRTVTASPTSACLQRSVLTPIACALRANLLAHDLFQLSSRLFSASREQLQSKCC